MPRWSQYWILLNTGLAAFLRFPGLFANTFTADEALFATWARTIAVWRDPLLITQAVDKPPLLFYLQALFYPLQGPVEWAARLPNFMASLLLIPLVGLLVWRLYGDGGTAVLAATFITLSPYTIQFAPTAFTDPLLTALLVASLVLLVTPTPPHHVTLSGLFFGLALATKYQAVLFMPLVMVLALWRNWRNHEWRSWLLGFLPTVFLLFLWEWARTGTFSLWSAQISNFGGLRLIWSWELWPRLVSWLDLWQVMAGSAVLGILFVLLLGVLWWHGRLPDQLFILFIIAYMAFHWFLAIPIWDRYLLPLVPLVAILVGRGVRCIECRLPFNLQSPVSSLLLFALLISPALSARNGRYAIGGQPIADSGTAQIAQILLDAPYGTVLYDHWYSWQWRYHFFDKGVFVNWFPSPEALTEDLLAFGQDGTRYLVAPQSDAFLPIQRAVTTATAAATAA
jgi:4-amino-4-deoxy-L-arabinose transferase-like glycosyltransferase